MRVVRRAAGATWAQLGVRVPPGWWRFLVRPGAAVWPGGGGALLRGRQVVGTVAEWR